MKPRLLSGRASVTRTKRHEPRGVALESVAAEFALLAQRRARIARQLDLLGRQLGAATATLDMVHERMSVLAQRMDGIDPTLRPIIALPAPSPQPPAYPERVRGRFHASAQTGSPAARGQSAMDSAAAVAPARAAPMMPPRTVPPPRPLRTIPRRRPFVPD